MRIITLALATVFMISSGASAQKTHKVVSGQTLSHIAYKYGVTQSALLKANHLGNADKLKLGQMLVIPSPASAKTKLASIATGKPLKTAPAGSGKYVVRNGDHDWAIAKKLGTTVSELHRLNPGANWRTLQIGQTLRVPAVPGYNLAGFVPGAPKKAAPGGTYVVRKNDNDWIIARRVGTTPSQLRAVNPGVKWTGLQIGQKIQIPGGKSVASGMSLAANKISTRHATIAKDNVTIRRGPTTSAARVTTVPLGTYVTVLDRESGWYKLKFPKGTVGWVRGDMLKPLSSRVVARATTRNRRTNYVASNYSAPSRPLGTASGGVVDTAMSMLGAHYRYGAVSRNATDCSGLTLQAYKAHGIQLPRTSREQAKVGQAVRKDELKKGDLVFFKRGSRIGHVGMYIGDGKFVHASSSGRGVRVDSLNSGTYQRRYAGARRVAKISPKEQADIKKLEEQAKEMERKAKEDEKASAKGVSEPAFDPPAKDPEPKDSKHDGQ